MSGFKQPLKIAQPNKGDGFLESVIGKRQRQSGIGGVFKNEKPDQSGNQHQKQPALLP